MNRRGSRILLVGILGISAFSLAAAKPKKKARAAAAKSAAELEKEKAMKSPYPSDLGPATLDVSGYPADIQEGYKVMLAKCAQCHSAARPLNHRFVEPDPAGKDAAKQEAAVASLKKTNPEIFKDPLVWQVEAQVWRRYVKRMMAKPGCNIAEAEGGKIYKFFVHDGNKRKLGGNAAKWQAHRKKLIDEFKTKHGARYKELEGRKEL